uniref:Uncharacterized protein n=1 Tax=Zea mays TaxID=4577 RepID=C4IYH5_MAIZE|nr:unknown [Zea mays]ACR37076.1 unknown [Zea mays]
MTHIEPLRLPDAAERLTTNGGLQTNQNQLTSHIFSMITTTINVRISNFTGRSSYQL